MKLWKALMQAFRNVIDDNFFFSRNDPYGEGQFIRMRLIFFFLKNLT